jgi:hypothetical protein
MARKNNEHFGVMIFFCGMVIFAFGMLLKFAPENRANKTQAQFDELKGKFLELADINHKDEAIIKRQNSMIKKQTKTIGDLLLMRRRQ